MPRKTTTSEQEFGGAEDTVGGSKAADVNTGAIEAGLDATGDADVDTPGADNFTGEPDMEKDSATDSEDDVWA